VGETIADLPLIGLPTGAPPRPGTPEYEAWMAKRAQDAATPKQGNAETGSNTDNEKPPAAVGGSQ
jgi:hypothetical protein